MPVVSVAVLVLLVAAVVAVVVLLARMFAKDEPFYGAIGMCVLLGPVAVLTFVYVALGGS